jgi:hypothetical protein
MGEPSFSRVVGRSALYPFILLLMWALPRGYKSLYIRVSRETADLIDSLRGDLTRDEYIYRVLKKLREYCGNAIIPCIERVFSEKSGCRGEG